MNTLGNIDVPDLPSSPLIPPEAVELAMILAKMAQAQLVIKPATTTGDSSSQFVFRDGGTVFTFVLPIKAPAMLPSLSAGTAAAFDTEQALTFSSPPTQAQVQALYAYTQNGFRWMAALYGQLKQNTFPQ